MPLGNTHLIPEARWTRLFRAFKAVRGVETDSELLAELRVAEHKLRLTYTLKDYPKETTE